MTEPTESTEPTEPKQERPSEALRLAQDAAMREAGGPVDFDDVLRCAGADHDLVAEAFAALVDGGGGLAPAQRDPPIIANATASDDDQRPPAFSDIAIADRFAAKHA